MTDEEIRANVIEFVELEIYELEYMAWNIQDLPQEDIDKLNDEIQRIARWFRSKKPELMQALQNSRSDALRL